MITRLKKHNDSLFLILLLILLSGGSWFFNHNMSGKIFFLEGEVKKIEKQDLSFLKQNNDLLTIKKDIQNNIDTFSTLQTNIQDNKTEDIKKELSKNPKSNELLAILPPSEIANIQQTESRKKITEDITLFKEKSAILWQSISKMGNEDFSETQFSIGNISDSSLKNTLHSSLSNFLKKEKDLFNPIVSYDSSLDKFSLATERLEQIYPLLKEQQNTNKQLIKEKIASLNKELYIVQIISLVGIVSLVLVLIFVTLKKRRKNVNEVEVEHSEINEYEKTISTDAGVSLVSEITPPQDPLLYDEVVSTVTHLNQVLDKQINLHFDVENFESLTIEQQEKLKDISLELIKYGMYYSFESQQQGDIIISLKSHDGHYTFLFKDNGKGLNAQELKEKIKIQYGVGDKVFENKTNQQIYSFIFKPGFEFISTPKDLDMQPLQLDVAAQFIKDINASISLSTEENHGTEFLINFQSI